MNHQIDGKNRWLLLSARFMAKFVLVFILTLENTFSQMFHFKANKESIDASKKQVLGIFKIALRLRDWACFFVTITGNCERFQYFNFETDI